MVNAMTLGDGAEKVSHEPARAIAQVLEFNLLGVVGGKRYLLRRVMEHDS